MKIIVLSAFPQNYSCRRFKEEAKFLGHELEVANPYQFEHVPGDAYLPRVSGEYAHQTFPYLAELEKSEKNLLNGLSSIRNCCDQWETIQCLKQHDLPTPHSVEDLTEGEWNYPYVIKSKTTSQGRGVFKVTHSQQEKDIDFPPDSFFYQRYISADYELRVLVLEDKVLAAYLKHPSAHDWRSNWHQGAKIISHNLRPHEKFLALKASEAVGTKLAGVDLIVEGQQCWILEVNSSPGFEGVEKSLDINIARSIVEALICKKN